MSSFMVIPRYLYSFTLCIPPMVSSYLSFFVDLGTSFMYADFPLFLFNWILLFWAHFSTVSIRYRRSSFLDKAIRRSSAKAITTSSPYLSTSSVRRSFMYSSQRNGDRIAPCGTPQFWYRSCFPIRILN